MGFFFTDNNILGSFGWVNVLGPIPSVFTLILCWGFVSICGYLGVHLSIIVGQPQLISLLHKEGHMEGGSDSISIKPFLLGELVGNIRKMGVVVGTCNL